MNFSLIAIKYLRSCGMTISESFISQRMESHPDYPYLIALTDTLDEMRIRYSVYQVDKEKTNDLHFPLLAHVIENGQYDFRIIRSLAEMEQDKGSFFTKWDGVFVIVEEGSIVNNSEHDAMLKNEMKNEKIEIILSCLGSLLYFIIAFRYFDIYAFIFSLLSISGIIISVSIFFLYIGKSNNLAEKLCNKDGSVGCEQVFESKVGKIFKDVTLADIGVIYFASVFLFLSIATTFDNVFDAFILIAIPVSISFFIFFIFLFLSMAYNPCMVHHVFDCYHYSRFTNNSSLPLCYFNFHKLL